MAKSIQGFKVLSLKFSTTCKTSHKLFIKEHSVRNQSQDKPSDRTLLVLNVPPYATEDSFKRVFSCVGPVQKVIFQSKPSSKDIDGDSRETNIKGFKVAYVVYQKASSVQNALKLTKLEPLSTEEHPVAIGIRKWAMEYNAQIYDHVKLEEEVNKSVRKFDADAEKKKQQEKEADDGGWTVVKKKGISRKENVKNKLLEKTQKGEKRKQLPDFYKFQKREAMMNHLVEKRKKEEEEKKRINFQKLQRKFRPF